MKKIDKFLALKNKYSDSLVVIKSGNFYYSYFEDGIILNYLFNYQVINNRVGFPLKNLDKVLEELKRDNVSVVVNDIDNTKHEVKKNKYHDVKIEAIERYNEKKEIEDLIINIRYKIDKFPYNYKLIKEYVDEL